MAVVMNPRLQEVIRKLTDVRPYLQEKYGVSRLAIFGSTTRGDYKRKSDVDVLVDFSKPLGIEYIDFGLELEDLLGRKIDLLHTRPDRLARFMPYIQDDLIEVYA